MSAKNMEITPERINRLKVVLAEKNCKGKWLAEQLGKNEATISNDGCEDCFYTKC